MKVGEVSDPGKTRELLRRRKLRDSARVTELSSCLTTASDEAAQAWRTLRRDGRGPHTGLIPWIRV
jgi:hypothetical protein